MPLYASSTLLPISHTVRAVPQAFHFWLFVAVLVTAWLVARLWAIRRAMAQSLPSIPAEGAR